MALFAQRLSQMQVYDIIIERENTYIVKYNLKPHKLTLLKHVNYIEMKYMTILLPQGIKNTLRFHFIILKKKASSSPWKIHIVF